MLNNMLKDFVIRLNFYIIKILIWNVKVLKKYNYYKIIWKIKMIILFYKFNIVYEKIRELLKLKNKDDNFLNI